MDEFKRPDKLDSVEKKLYSPNSEIGRKERRSPYEKQYDIGRDWQADADPGEKPKENPLKKDRQKGLSFFTKLLIVAFVFFVGALSYSWLLIKMEEKI